MIGSPFGSAMSTRKGPWCWRSSQAFSRVCTVEMCTFRDQIEELRQLSATVFGISVDTFFALKAWRDAQQLNFSLLSDFNKDVLHLYEVYSVDLMGMRGTAKRAVFVIDMTFTAF